MQRLVWLTGISVLASGMAFGQIKKQFSVEDNAECKTIKLQIKANYGNCFIKPSHTTDILSVFSNQEVDSYSHHYKKEIADKVCEVYLSLEEDGNSGFSQKISSRVFSSEKPGSDNVWKMYLTDEKPYALELSYGLGNANVDLSGLSISRLRINTASADVILGYQSGLENQVEMDTLTIKVDLGSVHTKNISLAKTRYILADVGLGNITLDFSTPSALGNTIKGSVGAGNLMVLLPADDSTPVTVRIKDSWLCSVKMPGNLKKSGPNTFTNEAFQKNSANALMFDLDVSMGNIVFKQVSR